MRSVIRGAAVCVCAHVGRTLTVLVAVILTCAHANAQSPAISFVQSTQSAPQPLASAVSVQFTAAQNRGNLNVVVVGWHDSSAGVLNVSDSDGNQYLLAVGPTVYPGVATQAMYYASDIVGSVSSPNTVTVTFSAPAAWTDVRIAEYAGIATANPIDAVVAGLGSSAVSDSGTAGTSASRGLLVAANTVQTVVTGAGPGFTQRGITLPSSNVLQDRVVSAPGAYNATATVQPGVPWIMQMVAFRAADSADTQSPTAPATLSANAVSSTQITLTWSASTDNVGVTGYLIERCQGVGCATFAEVGTSATASFGDSGLTNATTYRYRVRAADAANNLSGYSNIATATTPASADTQAPTTPGAFSGTATSSTQVSLIWSASIDNVGVAGYRVSRNSNLIATVTTLSYADSGLNASTTYNYSIVAFDAAGNPSAPAATSVTTQAASTPPFVLASDNFNRPNGGLGAGWTVIDSDPRIVNQHIQETNASDGNDSIAIYTGLTWPADHYSQVTVRAATAHSGASAIVRAKNDPVIEMYFVYVTGPLGPAARLTLAKFVTHNYTELWTNVLPVNAGDTLYLGVQGTTLTVKLNGNTLATRTDGSITAAGYPGFDITDYDGKGAPGDGQLDDWFAGNVGSSTPSMSSLALNPSSVTGGGSSQATVTLTGPAPSGGAVVALASSNAAVAAVPGSVTVAAGATSAGFTVNTSVVGTATPVTISGSYQGSTASAVLTVNATGGAVPKGNWTLVSVDSQEIACENGAAVNAFDGSASTKWHTRYCPSSDPLAHEIQIDMGAGYQISAFRYLPRQDGSSNGRIGQFEFYATNDLTNWGSPLATGTFANNATEKQVSFAPNTYRYIRFRALTEVNGNRWTSVAELTVLQP